MKNERHRKQIADLILKDFEGRDLVIVSPLEGQNSDGSMSFDVGEDKPNGARYRVTVKIEEI